MPRREQQDEGNEEPRVPRLWHILLALGAVWLFYSLADAARGGLLCR